MYFENGLQKADGEEHYVIVYRTTGSTDYIKKNLKEALSFGRACMRTKDCYKVKIYDADMIISETIV